MRCIQFILRATVNLLEQLLVMGLAPNRCNELIVVIAITAAGIGPGVNGFGPLPIGLLCHHRTCHIELAGKILVLIFSRSK